jgi:hypothetical protein
VHKDKTNDGIKQRLAKIVDTYKQVHINKVSIHIRGDGWGNVIIKLKAPGYGILCIAETNMVPSCCGGAIVNGISFWNGALPIDQEKKVIGILLDCMEYASKEILEVSHVLYYVTEEQPEIRKELIKRKWKRKDKFINDNTDLEILIYSKDLYA